MYEKQSITSSVNFRQSSLNATQTQYNMYRFTDLFTCSTQWIQMLLLYAYFLLGRSFLPAVTELVGLPVSLALLVLRFSLKLSRIIPLRKFSMTVETRICIVRGWIFFRSNATFYASVHKQNGLLNQGGFRTQPTTSVECGIMGWLSQVWTPTNFFKSLKSWQGYHLPRSSSSSTVTFIGSLYTKHYCSSCLSPPAVLCRNIQGLDRNMETPGKRRKLLPNMALDHLWHP